MSLFSGVDRVFPCHFLCVCAAGFGRPGLPSSVPEDPVCCLHHSSSGHLLRRRSAFLHHGNPFCHDRSGSCICGWEPICRQNKPPNYCGAVLVTPFSSSPLPLRLEFDRIWFAHSVRAWRSSKHPPAGPAVPHAHLVISVGHRFHRCGGHVVHGLGAAVLCLHVHAKHVQKNFEEAGLCVHKWLVLKNSCCVFSHTPPCPPAGLGKGAAVGGPWEPAGGGLGRNGPGLW